MCVAAIGSGQTVNSVNVPSPSPGYDLFFHDSDAAPDIPSRWGYHDGWLQGRRSRQAGSSDAGLERTPQYVRPPDDGRPVGMDRNEYVHAYRNAFRRGYERGFRL
jgi:hypothetical protein